MVSASATLRAQAAPPAQTDIQPFVSMAVGAARTGTKARGNKGESERPVLDATLGARKRLVGTFGLVITANVGKVVDFELIGGDLSCRIQIVDGKPSGCLPASPLLDWYGVSTCPLDSRRRDERKLNRRWFDDPSPLGDAPPQNGDFTFLMFNVHP